MQLPESVANWEALQPAELAHRIAQSTSEHIDTDSIAEEFDSRRVREGCSSGERLG